MKLTTVNGLVQISALQRTRATPHHPGTIPLHCQSQYHAGQCSAIDYCTHVKIKVVLLVH